MLSSQALFPVTTCQPLTSLATKCTKLQATLLLALETSKVARGSIVISSPKALSRHTQLINVVGLSLHNVFVTDLHLLCSI